MGKTIYDPKSGEKYVELPNGGWVMYSPTYHDLNDITKSTYIGEGHTVNKQKKFKVGNLIITVGPKPSNNSGTGSNLIVRTKTIGNLIFDKVHKGVSNYVNNSQVSNKNTGKVGVTGSARTPNYYNTIDEALAGYGLGTKQEIKNKYGVDLDEYTSVLALLHAIGGLNEDNKFGVKTRNAFLNWLQLLGRVNAGTLNTTPKIENAVVNNLPTDTLNMANLIRLNWSKLGFTTPQRYNRADVRNRLREMGYNPYDLSGKQRRALRKAWNRPYEESLMNMYGKYVPTPDTSNFLSYRYNPINSKNWEDSVNTYFGKYNGKIGKNSYWDTSKIAPAILAVKEGLLNKSLNTIEQKLNNSNGGLLFVKRGGSLPSRNPIERFKKNKFC